MLKLSRSSGLRVFFKKRALKSFAKFTEKNFIKKEALAQVFSYEFCEIFKNTYFHRTPPLALVLFAFDFIVFYSFFPLVASDMSLILA